MKAFLARLLTVATGILLGAILFEASRLLWLSPATDTDWSGCAYAQCATTTTTTFPLTETGQTTSFQADKNDGISGPVDVPDDGALKRGVPLRYTDNGDGTITDNNTGLMWEKKSYGGTVDVHDQNKTYPWTSNGSTDTIWDWLDKLNTANFAGHNDWRIPNIRELLSIVDYGYYSPAVSPVFNTGCVSGCTVLTCSCTYPYGYWSSSTRATTPTAAWYLRFDLGGLPNNNFPKTAAFRVRAVRGGTP